MQTINFSEVILGLNGKPIVTKQQGTELTLEDVCLEVLSSEVPAPVDEKRRKAAMARKIINANFIDMTAEEVAFLKDLVGKQVNHPIVCDVALDLLDPPVEENEADDK